MKNEFVYLAELASKINRLLASRTPILLPEQLESEEFKYVQLYRVLRERRHKSERALAKEAVGMKDGSAEYKALRGMLKRRMLESLFHLDLKKTNIPKAGVAEYDAMKISFQAKLLLRLGMRGYAFHFAKDALEIAQRFELTAIEIEMLHILRTATYVTGSQREYDKYSDQLRHALAVQRAEFEAATYRERLILLASRKIMEDAETATLAMDSALELERLYRSYNRIQIGADYYRLKSNAYQLSFQYRKALETCDEWEAFTKAHADLIPPRRFELSIKRLVCAVHLRDREAGEIAITDCEEDFPVGDENWFTFKEYHFLFLMHTERFEEAEAVLDSATSHQLFQKLPDARREAWVLFEHYLDFARGRQRRRPVSPKKQAAQLSRELPVYSKDKAGHNVSLIILQILLLIGSADLSLVSDRIQALRNYIQRYLKSPENRQSAIFLRLLMLLEKENFDVDAAREKGLPLLYELSRSHAESGALEGYQILPYDWIWDRILQELETIPKL